MPVSHKTIVRVAVPSPPRRLFDYKVKDNCAFVPNSLVAGMRVSVPFGRRQIIGIIIEITNHSDIAPEKLKDVTDFVDDQPILSGRLLKLFKWASSYYQFPIGETLFHSLPILIRNGEPLPELRERYWTLSQKGIDAGEELLVSTPRQCSLFKLLKSKINIKESFILEQFSRSILSKLEERGYAQLQYIENERVADDILVGNPRKPNQEQQSVLDAITLNDFNCWLIDGITGSGKTEIYLKCIEKILLMGKQALVLIPEINLTPQTERRFNSRFNVPIVVLHSGITKKQRLQGWAKSLSGEVKIILGTRSAVFTPMKKPGLIVVDEEHDSSYKQQDGFRYSARDLSVMRAQYEDIPILLGSATPSLESLRNCDEQRYRHLMLTKRAGSAAVPKWQTIDMRQEKIESGFAETTLSSMADTLDRSEQVLVFLNRRGFAPVMLCKQCGWAAECKYCDSKMTLHRSCNQLICHHCGARSNPPIGCPSCGSGQLIASGEGTERSELMLQDRFRKTQILRVDRDTTKKRGHMLDVIQTAQKGDPCILLGTQMLAKGHHFQHVTLVVIVDADASLLSPDFRSTERMGQLLTQVAGRSGRGKLPGNVLVQSYQPHHPVLQILLEKGYGPFARQLLAHRREVDLPPYQYLALVRAESKLASRAERFLLLAKATADSIRKSSRALYYTGPLPALLERRSGRYRYILRIESKNRKLLNSVLDKLARNLESDHSVRWCIDVDPQEF